MFFVGMVLVQGSAVLRIFHGIIIIVVFMSAEMIYNGSVVKTKI